MELNESKHYFDGLYGFKFIDRRKPTPVNKIRRFVNNYWLIPVFTLCLELFAVVSPPIDSPIKKLKDRNISFFKGPIILYKLISTDFPYALIGHVKEIAIVNKYTFSVDQIPAEEVTRALENRESISKIYRRVIESKEYDNTEIGGIATLEYDSGGPKFHLYEITSLNRIFSEKLHRLENSSREEFLSFIQERDSREILTKVGIDEMITNSLRKVLLSEKPNQHQKMHLIKGFIKNYDIHSEAKYILSPYDFKSILGSGSMHGKYVGLFHFHNSYMEPPSEVDIANSYMDRQLVITLGNSGIVVYDLVKGKEVIHRGDLIS